MKNKLIVCFAIVIIQIHSPIGFEIHNHATEISGADFGLFVATDGSDKNDGSLARPFATLEKARNTIREWKRSGQIPAGGVTVYLRGGVYKISKTFELTEEDSGTANDPITYCSYDNEKAVISGAVKIDFGRFSPIMGEMKSRLKPEAREKVVVGDLRAMGIDTTQPVSASSSGMRYTLFGPLLEVDGKRTNLARWPNSDYRSAWPLTDIIERHSGEGQFGIISYDADALESWTYQSDEIWYLGYWRYEWAAEFVKAANNPEAKTLTLTTNYNYPVTLGEHRPAMRAYNVYEELDEPGEWFVDRTNKKIYFYPYDDTHAQSVITMTNPNSSFDFFRLNNTSYITIRDLEITGGRRLAIVVNNGSHNRIDGCIIHLFENGALDIAGENGRNNGIINSSIYNCGSGGIMLGGGSLDLLIPAGNFVLNCEIFDIGLIKEVYAACVNMSGVGNLVSNNEFYNTSHQALGYSGAMHIIEYNYFHNVCKNSADMGAIYSGRRIFSQGNIIRYNRFRNIGDSGTQGQFPVCIFVDDGNSNMEAYGNVCGPEVDNVQAFKVHGGMKNKFYNNLVIDAPRVYYQNIWLRENWYRDAFDSVNTRFAALATSVSFVKSKPIYFEKWPYLKEVLKEGISADTAPYVPEFPNEVSDNAILYINKVSAGEYQYRYTGNTQDSTNYFPVNERNAHFQGSQYKVFFKDFDRGNYTLTKEAYEEIRKISPNFQEIPFDKIGRLPRSEVTPPDL